MPFVLSGIFYGQDITNTNLGSDLELGKVFDRLTIHDKLVKTLFLWQSLIYLSCAYRLKEIATYASINF